MLANSQSVAEDKESQSAECKKGQVTVVRVTSGIQTCVNESIARDWMSKGIPGLAILNEDNATERTIISPGSVCQQGYKVIYHTETSEYECVLEETAEQMIQDNTGKVHTLVQYILDRDEQKIKDGKIYDINQKIDEISKEYSLKKKDVEQQYQAQIDRQKADARKQIQEIISSAEGLTKEHVSILISEVKVQSEAFNKEVLEEKSGRMISLGAELDVALRQLVKGFENNPDINVDWDRLLFAEEEGDEHVKQAVSDKQESEPVHESDNNEVVLENVGIVNSFGKAIEDVRSEQVLQLAADITNSKSHPQEFVYLIEVKNELNEVIQAPKWVTGRLNPEQTLNIGLSWIPQETGNYNATIAVGTGMDSIIEAADIRINVT